MNTSASTRVLRSGRSAAALLIITSFIAVPVRGQAPDTIQAYRVRGVTVTTTRSTDERSTVPRKIDVVSETDIERSGARNAAEALRSTTPIDVITYPGLLTGVSVRGVRPQYFGITARTLLLVDGLPAGTNNLAVFPLAGVERIEVLHGPASSLYGSSAMGGVINVIRRQSTGALSGRISSAYGSFGRYDGQLTLGGSVLSALDFDLDLSATGQREGYRVGSHRTFAGDSMAKREASGTISHVPWVTADSVLDFTEFGALSGRLRLGYSLSPTWRLAVQGEAFQADGVQNPGDLNPVGYDSRTLKDVSRRSGDVLLAGRFSGHTPRLRLFLTDETVDNYNAPEGSNFVNFRTPTRTLGGQLQDELRMGSASLIFGGDVTQSDAESEAFSSAGVPRAPFSPNSTIRSLALFGQGRAMLLDDRLSLTAGARLDRVTFSITDTPHLEGEVTNSEDHEVISPNLGARFDLIGGLQVYGSVGRGFVTPEAFYVAGYSERSAGTGRRAVFVTRGNPDLDPETSRTWEGGASLFLPSLGLDAELGYFDTDVTNRVTSELLPQGPPTLTAGGDTILSTMSYRNVDVAEIRGIEARISHDLRPVLGIDQSIRLFAAGTRILKAEERAVESDAARRILNVADLTLVGGIEYDDFELFSGRLTGRYVGERSDNDYVAWWAPGEIRYPAYMVVDANGGVRLGRYQMRVALLNLLDEDYFEVRGYNLAGRSARLEIGYEF